MKDAQQLMALRVTRAYCTVSYEAATLIAPMPPITLIAKERSITHKATNRAQALRKARKETMTTGMGLSGKRKMDAYSHPKCGKMDWQETR